MKVWLLYTGYEDRFEGAYSEVAKEAREQQFYEEALKNREHKNAVLAEEIEEFKALRQPYIEEADRLLAIEREAKEVNNTYLLKETRQQRKVALRQVDKLTNEIKRRETNIYNSMLLVKKDILSFYGSRRYWQEEHVIDVE